MKTFAVVFAETAIDDIEQAVAYYEEIQLGLGKRFTVQLQLTLSSIKRNPFFASVRYDKIRCAATKKYPFLIHYYIDESSAVVTILAVYSIYKNPLW